MLSDRQLVTWYNKYNKKYWSGELPDVVIFWEPPPKCDGVTCPIWEVSDGCFVIKLDPAIKGEPCWWRQVLLHEMCHVAIWRKYPKHSHGKVFQDEKNRLYAMGALRNLW